MCAWAIYALVDAVGETCFAGQDHDLQEVLHAAVVKLDAYVARNGKDMTPAKIAEFKHVQAHVDAGPDLLCRGDALAMYQAMKRAQPDAIRSDLDRLLARDGTPTWGTCL